MSDEPLQVGAIGAEIRWVATEDLSGLSAKELRMRKPGETARVTLTPLVNSTTVITNDTLTYTTLLASELDKGGDYDLYLHAEFDAQNIFDSKPKKFQVQDPGF